MEHDYETKILDQFATELGEEDILEVALSKAIQLASALDAWKHTEAEERTEVEYNAIVAPKIARMALILDVLQLKFGNVEEQELEFLQTMEIALQTLHKE